MRLVGGLMGFGGTHTHDQWQVEECAPAPATTSLPSLPVSTSGAIGANTSISDCTT